MQLQAITQIIQPDTVGQLRIQQANRMAPRTESARPILRAGLPGYLRDPVLRNEIANLAQDVKSAACWFDCFLFHPCRVAGLNRQANTFLQFPVGWLWKCFMTVAALRTAL